MMLMKHILTLLCSSVFISTCLAEDTALKSGWGNLTYSVNEEQRTAALYIPVGYDAGKSWPLVTYLHGGGGGGDNKGDAVSWGSRTPLAHTIARHSDWVPALVLMPRCPRGKIWAPGPKDPIQSPWRLRFHGTDPVPDAADHITAAIDKVMAEYSVDADRLSLMGHSMGGEGSTLYAAQNAERFSAVAPSAGSAIIVPEYAEKLATIGVWMFQGEKDNISTAVLARQMVAAIKEAGGNVKYSELEGVGHNSMKPMLEDEAVFKWLLSQRRLQ
jgi:predicted peptidase